MGYRYTPMLLYERWRCGFAVMISGAVMSWIHAAIPAKSTMHSDALRWSSWPTHAYELNCCSTQRALSSRSRWPGQAQFQPNPFVHYYLEARSYVPVQYIQPRRSTASSFSVPTSSSQWYMGLSERTTWSQSLHRVFELFEVGPPPLSPRWFGGLLVANVHLYWHFRVLGVLVNCRGFSSI